MDYYREIFKRKSFHFFKERESISERELADLNEFMKGIVPLNPQIKTEIKIVKEEETTCKRGGEYCILFFSEEKARLADQGIFMEQK